MLPVRAGAFCALLSLAFAVASGAPAQETRTLGVTRLFSNDLVGDGHDRWRSGGYGVSLLRGPAWTGALPGSPGRILEYRLRSEVIAPAARAGRPGYRPYVGAVSLGVHTPFALGPLDASAGVDVMAIGPQSGVADFQEGFHHIFGLDPVRGSNDQLGNAVHVGGTVELAYPVRLSSRLMVRPFAEGQAGIETLARVGVDVVLGPVGQRDLLTRDPVTGHLIRAVPGDAAGFALIAGADWAQVEETVYLPDDRGITPENDRWRARAGIHWQLGDDISVFYGATYLSEEYEGQPEGQIVGSLKLNFNF